MPYEQRLQTLAQSGGTSVEALLDRVTLRITLPGGTVYPQSARPTSSSAEIDPLTGMLDVTATIANPDLVLLPGLSVRVISHVEGVEQILAAIPRGAERSDAQGLYAAVVQASGLVERRPISLLRADHDRLLVGGLFEGETVITDADFQAAPGVLVTPNSAR